MRVCVCGCVCVCVCVGVWVCLCDGVLELVNKKKSQSSGSIRFLKAVQAHFERIEVNLTSLLSITVT